MKLNPRTWSSTWAGETDGMRVKVRCGVQTVAVLVRSLGPCFVPYFVDMGGYGGDMGGIWGGDL